MIKEKNIILNKESILLIRTVLIISCPFFTFMVSKGLYVNHIVIGCLFSLVAAIFIFSMIKIDNTIDKKTLLISILIACYYISNALKFSGINIVIIQTAITRRANITIPTNVISNFIGLFSFPTILFFVKWFLDHIWVKIIDFFQNLTNIERKYIYFTLIAALMISLFVINITIVFSRPSTGQDVIFTSDTSNLLGNDVFMDISHQENDIRQPLFGMFALPLGLMARVISKFCFFFRTQYEYETVITIFQALLLAITTILLARLLKISEDKKKYFYLFISCSFPYILFTILLEQYVMALFYLILTIYYYAKNPYKTNYLYVGAVGTLVTSGILFPLITKFKNFKQWIYSVCECFLFFAGSFVITGQTPQVFTAIRQIKSLLNVFAKGQPFISKLYQYTAFVRGLFLPNTGVIKLNFKPSYQSVIYTSIDWIGVIILVVCLLSFILNRKNKMALISMVWIVFSSVILLFAGWGTVENGLVLYSLYFAWAFYVLIYLLLDKICKKKKVFKFLLLCLISTMIFTGIYELFNMFSFGITYYP